MVKGPWKPATPAFEIGKDAVPALYAQGIQALLEKFS
jgi:hypothetical protein